MNGLSLRVQVRPLVLSMLVLSACGRFGPQWIDPLEVATTGPAIALHEATLTPGCFSPQGRRGSDSRPELTEVEAQLLAAELQMRDFRMSFVAQEATLIIHEVLRDPTATHWSRQEVGELGELFIEGFSTARGEGWGRLHFIASFIPADDSELQPRADINAEIRYGPQSTHFDFGDEALHLHDNYIVWEYEAGTFLRGCDPRTQTSFEVHPVNSRAAALVEPTMCWTAGDEAPVFETDRQAEEFTASRRLQCLQIVSQVTL